MADLQRVSLDEVVAHFQELEDPRSTINQLHLLASVVVISLLAALAGASGLTSIARWAAEIVEGQADYVLALKGNHEALHQAVIDYIDEQLEGDLAGAQEHVTTEEGHGREEVRTYL